MTREQRCPTDHKTRTKIYLRMIVFNKKMMFLLKRQPISNRLSKGLANLLKEGITVNGQCIFFKRFFVNNPHITLDMFDDMTAYECFLNNVHIEDFCRKNILSNAFIFANRLENILKEIKYGYEIILTIDRESCVLTFHSLHEPEAEWIDLCKIDDYKCGIALFRSQE